MTQTVGKTYIAAGGLKFLEGTLSPEMSTKNPVHRAFKAALSMQKYIDDFTYKAGKKLQIKIAINFGSCVVGVLGYHKPQFTMIGNTVKITPLYCKYATNGQIILSKSAYEQIKEDNLASLRVDAI